MMKKTISLVVALIVSASFQAFATGDITEMLKGLASKASGKQSTETTTTTTTQQTDSKSSSGSSILDKLTSVGNALGIIPAKTVDAQYLAGTWTYDSPAVAFKSENFLAKAGGVAASAKVESEIEPYYKNLGLTSTVLTCEADSTFTMKVKAMTLSGTFTANNDDEATLTFHFKVAGKIPVGSMTTYINAISNTQMDMTFDVSKLMTIIKKVSAITGNKSISTLSSLLDNYDGITAGFTFVKTN